MLNAIKKLIRTPAEVDFSCIMVVYKSRSGAWRGFAHPYDVTIEADTEEKAFAALKEMVVSYEEGLKSHSYPSHLSEKQLSDEEDVEKFNQVALNSIAQQKSVRGTDFYAEAKTVSA